MRTFGKILHGRTQIWAHRGASGYAPENTLPSFEMAKRQMADGIELDVQMSADGELVVVHDEQLERVSDGTGFVKDYTLAELKKFNFSKVIPGYEDTQIPTLGEVYHLMKDSQMTVNVEIKTGEIWYEGIEEKILRETDKYEMKNKVIYSSFNHQCLRRIKKLDSTCKTGMLFMDIVTALDAYAASIPVEALHPGLHYIKMCRQLENCGKSDFPMRVWTVNQKEDMEYLIRNGIDTVITNYPDVAVEVREKVCAQK